MSTPPSTETSRVAVPKRGITTELAVGVFALVGLGCFAYLSIDIARMNFWRRGVYLVKAEFSNVAGLKVGAPVEIAGVGIGKVSQISLKDTSALVEMDIKNEVQLRDDDIAAIRTKGIIGDRYIKIVPGGSDKVVPSEGALSETESAVELEEILGKFIHRME